MVDEFNPPSKHVIVAFDEWYFCGEMVKHVEERGFDWISEAKRNCVVFYNGERLSMFLGFWIDQGLSFMTSKLTGSSTSALIQKLSFQRWAVEIRGFCSIARLTPRTFTSLAPTC
jgi:hypothetical protein